MGCTQCYHGYTALPAITGQTIQTIHYMLQFSTDNTNKHYYSAIERNMTIIPCISKDFIRFMLFCNNVVMYAFCLLSLFYATVQH